MAQPHHEFYRNLTDVCGVDASRILMIGDDPQNDVRGAQQAGLRALLIERRHSDRIEDEEVPSISSLCGLLET
ncbi:MAG: HAD hydrolase-like protein [Planctomycetaceae bacterium]